MSAHTPTGIQCPYCRHRFDTKAYDQHVPCPELRVDSWYDQPIFGGMSMRQLDDRDIDGDPYVR